MSEQDLDALAKQLHTIIKDLLRSFQLRDRNEIMCYGVSVSQCYALDVLAEHGPMTMNQLAEKMLLTTSTMTRIVDQLVKRELVERTFAPQDRRIVRVGLTTKGAEMHQKLHECMIASQREILKRIKPEEWENLISALEEFVRAVKDWRRCCCGI